MIYFNLFTVCLCCYTLGRTAGRNDGTAMMAAVFSLVGLFVAGAILLMRISG